ncbi:MAG: hypothetical protein CVT88_04385 [Candidatus Altiarchaeales archaeon HGW-Altiarchaeales-1]|nr:MAG: hypothetical protein CVT88_04385 [Candidatus Altiarchaeales archaeon HGW-Altiarchaeales-1]
MDIKNIFKNSLKKAAEITKYVKGKDVAKLALKSASGILTMCGIPVGIPVEIILGIDSSIEKQKDKEEVGKWMKLLENIEKNTKNTKEFEETLKENITKNKDVLETLKNIADEIKSYDEYQIKQISKETEYPYEDLQKFQTEVTKNFDEINKKLDKLINLIESPLLTPDEFERRQKIKILLKYRFIGRTDELQELRKFLDGNEKIKLITGGGGVGKTRFVIEFAKQVEKRDNQDVYFIHPYNNFNFGLVPTEKKVLLILDDSSRYTGRDKLIDAVLNPHSKERDTKLLLIDRPIFKNSIEAELKRQEATENIFSSLQIKKGDILGFLKENFPEIDEDTDKKIESECKNSFIYAVFYAEYYNKKKEIGNLNDILSVRCENYIKDIAMRKNQKEEDTKKIISLISLIRPVKWDSDKIYLEDNLTLKNYEILEEIKDVAQLENNDILLFSDNSELEIKPDPIADYILSEFLRDEKFDNWLKKVLPYMPRRIAYNLFVTPRFNEKIQDEISGLLGKIWEKLNTSEFKSPEYFEAIIMFTGDFRSFKFFDIEKINAKQWIENYNGISVDYKDDEGVRGELAKGLYNAATYYRTEKKFDEMEKCLNELRKLHESYKDDEGVRGEMKWRNA